MLPRRRMNSGISPQPNRGILIQGFSPSYRGILIHSLTVHSKGLTREAPELLKGDICVEWVGWGLS